MRTPDAQEFPNGYSGVVHSSAAIKIALVTWSEPVAKASPTAERIMSGSGVSEIRDFYGGKWDSQHLIFEASGGTFFGPLMKRSCAPPQLSTGEF
jgi:hypothetical protein